MCFEANYDWLDPAVTSFHEVQDYRRFDIERAWFWGRSKNSVTYNVDSDSVLNRIRGEVDVQLFFSFRSACAYCIFDPMMVTSLLSFL